MRVLRLGIACLVLGTAANLTSGAEAARSAPKRTRSPAKTPVVQKAAAEEPAASQTTVRWTHDPDSALERAQETGRPMLLVFGGKRCVWCRRLERETLADPQVAELVNLEFIAVHLDVQDHPRLAEALDVDGLPTTVVLTAEGDVLANAPGFRTAPKFRSLLKAALKKQEELAEPGVATIGGAAPLEMPVGKR